jgi:hypothetical protein
MPQKEFAIPISIFDNFGKLCNFGWARQPFFNYDPALLWTPRRLIYEQERYVIYSPTHLFVFELCDGGILGHLSITAISRLDKKIARKFEKISFPMGSLQLPSQSESAQIKKTIKKNRFEFDCVDRGNRIIIIDIPQIFRNTRLRGEVALMAPPDAQSIVTHSSWRGEKERFQLIRCSPWYNVEGVMQFENAPLLFSRGRAWGIYEWSRIARPKQDIHFWAAACGLQGGQQIGFSVGYSSVDSSSGTENAFFVDGTLHKLDQVTFKISPVNWLDPWFFTSNNKRLEMQFNPAIQSPYQNDLLFCYQHVRQFFGTFSGKIILDDGNTLHFDNITGLTERRKTYN